MPLRPPLGQSDFVRIRQDALTYVDKTREVADILDDPALVLLITRPRRFGKTLLFSTLQAWVQTGAPQDELFAGLAIAADPRAAAWKGRHPVISLSLRDVRAPDLPGLVDALGRHMRDLYNTHDAVRHGPGFTDGDALAWSELMREAPSRGAVMGSLTQLIRWLHVATGQTVVVLIDEYDTPLHQAWLHGYDDEALDLLRPFFAAALKDNRSLQKAVLTGITRLASESTFSGLNHLVVDSLLDRRFPTAAGFTEAEVRALLAAAGRSDRFDDVRTWYDGYEIPGVRLYNPWSILAWLADADAALQPYWVNTTSDELLRSLLATGAPGLQADVEAILRGEAVEKPIVDHLVLRDLPDDVDAVWTLLVHAGYLQVMAPVVQRDDARWAWLRPPNLEVAAAWRTLFRRWMDGAMAGGAAVRALTHALLRGDGPAVEAALQGFAARNLSSLDPAGDAPERVWHAFVLGLLVHLSATHRVQSEAAAGFGRADVLVAPLRPGAGAVLEFKRRGKAEEAEEALDAAMAQIDARGYVDRIHAATTS